MNRVAIAACKQSSEPCSPPAHRKGLSLRCCVGCRSICSSQRQRQDGKEPEFVLAVQNRLQNQLVRCQQTQFRHAHGTAFDICAMLKLCRHIMHRPSCAHVHDTLDARIMRQDVPQKLPLWLRTATISEL